jgi:hypothetical protein
LRCHRGHHRRRARGHERNTGEPCLWMPVYSRRAIEHYAASIQLPVGKRTARRRAESAAKQSQLGECAFGPPRV